LKGFSFGRLPVEAGSLRAAGLILVAGLIGYLGTGFSLHGPSVSAPASPTFVAPTPTVAHAVTFTPAPLLTGTPGIRDAATSTLGPSSTPATAIATTSPGPTVSAHPTTAPTPTPAPTPIVYVVQSGDTIEGISQKFGVTENAIVQANKLADPNTLSLGEKLVIPK